ncbi:MAG: glycosyl hydrolase family 28-related protein [Pseudorhodoplanes sp.]|uniref:glycosyl hydrolase family 28-related protein n=1 Tax=Pseudorhodoplanes sp. TaxID=1934341 RepID=UPI003D0DE6AB
MKRGQDKIARPEKPASLKRRAFLNMIRGTTIGMSAAAVPLAAAHAQRAETDGRSGATFDVRQFGARGDGASDDSRAIQTAIDRASAAGGGVVEFPPGDYRCIGIVLKPNVDLNGLQRRSILRARSIGTLLTVPQDVRDSSVHGLSFRGVTDRSPSVGLRLHGIGNFVSRCDFNGFADEGILIAEGGLVHHLEYVFADNCLRVPRSKVSGVLTVGAHDCTLFNVEIAGGLGTRLGQILEPDDNNWCIYIIGANTFMTDCVAEVGQGGIRIAASSQQNRIENTRSDLNARHGWFIEGTRSQFSNCIALNCGLEGMQSGKAVGWPGWYLLAAAHNTFTNCRNHLEGYDGNVTFGFEEYGDDPGRDGNRRINNLIGCTSFGHKIAAFDTKSAGPLNGNNVHSVAVTIGSEEIEVYNLAILELRNAAATRIANFRGTRGQRVVIVGGTVAATIVHGRHIKTRTGQPLVVQPETAFEFVNVRDVWYQLV